MGLGVFDEVATANRVAPRQGAKSVMHAASTTTFYSRRAP